MVVVAIVAILSALAPMLASGTVLKRQMYSAATQLRQDVLLVQNQAITHSSGGPGSAAGFAMRLYLADNAFAYWTTEGATPSSGSSVPAPGTGVVVRTMPSTLGFPLHFGKSLPASVTIGSAAATSNCVDIVFDNQGLPYWSQDSGTDWTAAGTAGSVTLVDSSLSRQIQITVSVIGRVTVEWVPVS